ncbi:low density lipoprotein receptor adapter protein 1 [Dermatophagoides farinae]|uniref:Low density lipoprotein receptor adapter protein 1 n=1 Tax=Dermatophagoides farinae TaxID=6954 RepID=A0A9D4P6P7_DERFA|nr:low density lipoprotein receptor adapter protein 1-like [Dermatophagoides farinae]KAH7644893.1 low density lipoprotein receptor adapter protein 1 [Dermatophagoides farinae]
MTSIWKAIRLSTKNDKISELNTNFKHEKLFEELPNDGSTFYCQYLGYIPVESPSGAATNAKAIRQMMAMSRLKGTKSMALSILPNKIIIEKSTNKSNNNNDNDDGDGDHQSIMISLNRVSYCFVDSTYERVIAFVATNDNGCHECHAFMANKTKMAKLIAFTISKAFINAYEKWLQQKVLLSTTTTTTTTMKNNCPVQQCETTTTTTTNDSNTTQSIDYDWFDCVMEQSCHKNHDKQLLILD